MTKLIFFDQKQFKNLTMIANVLLTLISLSWCGALEAAIIRNAPSILARPVIVNGRKVGCVAVEDKAKNSFVLWETIKEITSITIKANEVGLPNTGLTTAYIDLPDQKIIHEVIIKKGFLSVALDGHHFASYMHGGTIRVGTQQIHYSDIAFLYKAARQCSRK